MRGVFMRKNKTANKKKVVVIFFLCAGLLTALAGRLVYLMVFRSDYYSERADDLHERERDIKAARGEILDANGTVLASNRTVCTISVIHSQIEEPEERDRHAGEGAGHQRGDGPEAGGDGVLHRAGENQRGQGGTGDRIRAYGYAGVKVDEDYQAFLSV